MFPKINPTKTVAWKKLQDHYKEMKQISIKDLFVEDAGRFEKYSFAVTDIICDFSKNIVNDETKTFSFENLQHVQQPMIEATVKYFLGEGLNPCDGFEGAEPAFT